MTQKRNYKKAPKKDALDISQKGSSRSQSPLLIDKQLANMDVEYNGNACMKIQPQQQFNACIPANPCLQCNQTQLSCIQSKYGSLHPYITPQKPCSEKQDKQNVFLPQQMQGLMPQQFGFMLDQPQDAHKKDSAHVLNENILPGNINEVNYGVACIEKSIMGSSEKLTQLNSQIVELVELVGQLQVQITGFLGQFKQLNVQQQDPEKYLFRKLCAAAVHIIKSKTTNGKFQSVDQCLTLLDEMKKFKKDALSLKDQEFLQQLLVDLRQFLYINFSAIDKFCNQNVVYLQSAIIPGVAIDYSEYFLNRRNLQEGDLHVQKGLLSYL